MSLARLSEFGDASGWIALILPVWLFTEEFRAAGYGAYRIVVALLGAGFGLAVGMTLAGLAAGAVPAAGQRRASARSALTVVYCAGLVLRPAVAQPPRRLTGDGQ